MAFRINVKTKAPASGLSKGKNILEDIRVFAVLMLIACAGLIAFIVLGFQHIDDTNAEIKKEMKTYQESQLSIANLKALQSKSEEYEAQRDAYNAMIPESLDQQQIMIEMETRTESMNCVLTDISFGSESADEKKGNAAASSGLVNQMQVQISVRGSYTDIMRLAESLVTDEELMRVDAIRITPMSQNGLKEAQITIMKFSKL